MQKKKNWLCIAKIHIRRRPTQYEERNVPNQLHQSPKGKGANGVDHSVAYHDEPDVVNTQCTADVGLRQNENV